MVRMTAQRPNPGTTSAFPGRDGEGFHEWLQGELKARRMSQRQLAQRSGVDHSSISRLVRGQRVPSLRTAMRIAHIVDLYEPNGDGYQGGAAPSVRAAARVECALRADDWLREADVHEVMLCYLAIRRGRPGSPDPASSEGMNVRIPRPAVARTAGSPGLWGSLKRRRPRVDPD